MAKELERFCLMALRQPRSEYWRGYITSLTDIYRANYTDNPKWLEMALIWYKTEGR